MDFDKLQEWVQEEINIALVERTIKAEERAIGYGVNRDHADKLFEELKESAK